MIYLKRFNESIESIDSICVRYSIENYTINRDGSIDVNGDVYLYDKNLTELPVMFNTVTGHFDCSYNNLTSLEGSPKEVGRDFECHNNNLTTLSGSPKQVGGDFYCSYNMLTTLEGSPERVGSYFNCNYNKLTTLKNITTDVEGDYYCFGNPLPKLILDNLNHIKIIIKEAEDFNIWRNNGDLNERNFLFMMDILKEEGKI